jgi:hypothetical protein
MTQHLSLNRKHLQMSLTANPVVNLTGADCSLSSMKQLQGFMALNPVLSTLSSQSYAWNLFPNTAANAAVLANILTTANINPPGVTWYLISLGAHSIWVSNIQGLSSTVAPPGSTQFQKVYSDGNDLYSAGDFSQGGSTMF